MARSGCSSRDLPVHLAVLSPTVRLAGKRTTLALPAGVADHIFGLCILPEPNKTAVTEVIVRGPLKKFEPPNQYRSQLSTLFHFRGR
jgi:hypothetical protein